MTDDKLTPGFCKFCKAPIADDSGAFCDRPADACWKTWSERRRTAETNLLDGIAKHEASFALGMQAALDIACAAAADAHDNPDVSDGAQRVVAAIEQAIESRAPKRRDD
jgi:hypothetical protein